MARSRTSSLTAQNTFSNPIALRKGGVVTLSGTWTATVSLQRYNKQSAAWQDVTSNTGTAVTYTTVGTFAIDPYGFEGLYRVGPKTGAYTSGTIVTLLEGV